MKESDFYFSPVRTATKERRISVGYADNEDDDLR